MAGNSFISSSKKIVKGIYIAAIWFILAETAARLFYTPEYIPDEVYLRTTPYYSAHLDRLPLCYVKNSCYHLWRTEDFRPWPKEFPVTKPPDEFRIFVFGLSVSYGEEDKNYPFYLEKLLNAIQTEKKIVVINCSYAFTGSRRLLILVRKCLQYAPDLIIVDGPFAEYMEEKIYADSRKISRFPQGIFLKSNVICLLKKVVARYVLAEAGLGAEIQNEWTAYLLNNKGCYERDAFEKMLETYRRKRGPFEETKNPENITRWTNTTFSNIESFSALLEKEGIPCIAMLTAYAPFTATYHQAMFNDQKVLSLFSQPSAMPGNINELWLSLSRLNHNVRVVDKSEILYKHIHLFPNKYAPFIDFLHLTARCHLIIAKELSRIVLEEYLFMPPTGNDIFDQQHLEADFLSPEDRQHFLLSPITHPDLIVLYQANHDRDILTALASFVSTAEERAFFKQSDQNYQRLYKYWLNSLKGWLSSEGF